MRAKFILAATLLLGAMQPVLADDLLCDVHETLYRPVHVGLTNLLTRGIITQRAVVAAPACGVAAGSACVNTIITEPAVLAPTQCGTAILTRDPSDLDIRRETLQRRIAELTGCGRLNACQATELNAAMTEVGQAEVCMRNDGILDNIESRRLYKAMDRIGSHLDRWSRTGYGLNAALGFGPGFWY
jgi:hypothetical protein